VQDGGCLPQARHLGSDVLQQGQVRRDGAWLKKLLVEQLLDNAILKDVAARCEAGGGGSCLRSAWGEPPSGVPGSEHRPFDGALQPAPARTTLGSVEAMKAIAAERRRFGYPREPHHAGPTAHRDEPEEAAAPLPGGEAAGAPARRPQGGALGTRTLMLVVPTLDGSWTSSPIPSPMAVASGCSPSSMTTRANALH
jgi:hypothetical protein